MSAILSLKYQYINPKDRSWFYKVFETLQELDKWLKDDSIILVRSDDLMNEDILKKLKLLKLQSSARRIITIGDCSYKNDYFIYASEDNLKAKIDACIKNKLSLDDNKKAISDIVKEI